MLILIALALLQQGDAHNKGARVTSTSDGRVSMQLMEAGPGKEKDQVKNLMRSERKKETSTNDLQEEIGKKQLQEEIEEVPPMPSRTMEVDPQLVAKLEGPKVVAIDEVCDAFHLDPVGCSRVRTYLGRTLRNLKEPLRIKHAVAEHFHKFDGDTTTASGLKNENVEMDPQRAQKKDLSTSYLETFKYVSRSIDDSHPFMLAGGDAGHMIPWYWPTLVQSAPVHETTGNHVITMLLRDYYVGDVPKIPKYDVPFEQKRNKLVWRGSHTGGVKDEHGKAIPCSNGHWANQSRVLLVSQYVDSPDSRIDVGFVAWGRKSAPGVPASWTKKSLKKSNLLRNKYIMVVQGTDVMASATWVLASNSVPFMPPPVNQGWDLQGWLEPWKHYIPVEPNFADVVEKLDWAEANPERVLQIMNAGKSFVKEFDDKDREARIHAAVLWTYFNRFRIERSSGESRIGSNYTSIPGSTLQWNARCPPLKPAA